jgi:hypothetical protein
LETTRRDFFKSAAPAVAAGALGFPAVVRADAPSDSVATGRTASAVASNGYLSSLLPLEDQVALRKINVSLTQLAIQQCAITGVANQIVFDTLICEALAAFLVHDVSPDDLIALSRDFDVVFLWSLAYGDVRTTFNARFIRFPLTIAFPRTVAEVVFWVNFVRDHQFSVSIRSGNNCYESFDIDNEIVIDLTFLTLRSSGTSEPFRLDLPAGVVHVAPTSVSASSTRNWPSTESLLPEVSVRRSVLAVWLVPEESAFRPGNLATRATSWSRLSMCLPTAVSSSPTPLINTPISSSLPKGPVRPVWAS